MAKHNVTIVRMPSRLVGKSDVVFDVRENDSKLGDLRVSQGNIFWRPFNCAYGHVLPWALFAEMMEKNGKRQKQKN